MSRALNMNCNVIKNVRNPVNNQDPSTKSFVEAGISNSWNIGGKNLIASSNIGSLNNGDVNIIRNSKDMINVYSYAVNINNNCYFSFINNTARMRGTAHIGVGRIFTFNIEDINNQIHYTYGQSINIMAKNMDVRLVVKQVVQC